MPIHNPFCEETARNADEGSLDIAACCLCHSALDYSDRAAFFRPDREEDYSDDDGDDDDYFFQRNDPFLPPELYDPNDALLYCDSCDRLYHQRCHFVPVFIVPRGSWYCLLCQSQKHDAHHRDGGRRQKNTLRGFVKKLKAQGKDNAIFRSPPVLDVSTFEKRWESLSSSLKASTLQRNFKQLNIAIAGQLSALRRADSALMAWTSSRRNARHFTIKSQELRQLVCTIVTCKYKIRSWLRGAEAARSGRDKLPLVEDWIRHAKPSAAFVNRVIFPFGSGHCPRREPRTSDYGKQSNSLQAISKRDSTEAGSSCSLGRLSHEKSSSDFDDDSGVSLDDLTCCICLENHASDENDLVLCDAAGCYRAWHQRCCKPEICDLDDDDWFCPFCKGLASLIYRTQAEYKGDEWEQRRSEKQRKGKRKARKAGPEDDEGASASSLQSWSNADDVFPMADREYETASSLRKGEDASDEAKALVARILGMDEPEILDDDEDDDDLFDLESYCRNREEDQSDENSHSSQATLVDMSSVEMEIEQTEIAELSGSDVGTDSVNEENNVHSSEGLLNGVRSYRLRRQTLCRSDRNGLEEIDEANIVEGKRQHPPVDYILLNEVLFGDLPPEEVMRIDDTEDFVE